jgi:hypothetical protein
MIDQPDGPDRAGDDLDRAPRLQIRWSRSALVGDAIHTAAGRETAVLRGTSPCH